jgi:hypothetical protein
MIYFGENGWIHSNAEERKSNYLVVFCREMPKQIWHEKDLG